MSVVDIYGGFPANVRDLFAQVGETPPPQDPNLERPPVDQPPRGRSGRAHFSGFIEIDEPNRKWIGVEGLRLADQMWRSDGDIKRATLAVWGPIQSATWAWEPYGGEQAGKKDKEAVEIIEWNLNEFMSPNFTEHLGELGPILIRSGYTDFEQIWKSVSQNGKKRVAVKKLDLRLPRTIWKFYQDEDGDLSGVVQFLPNSRSVWIPANDLLHYRIQAEGDNWTGTALALDTPIPTPDGWRLMEDLQEGDKVFDERGRACYVTQTSEWEDRPCYEVIFKDGTSIVADENHEWLTHTVRERYGKRDGQLRKTSELADTVIYEPFNISNHAIPRAAALDYPKQYLPIDPWMLGLWLGDGTAATGDIACHEDDLEETVFKIQEAGHPAKGTKNGLPGSKGRHIYTWGEGPNGLATRLRLLGLKNNKHIPEVYLRGSIEQRLVFLSGLMDSDGTVNTNGQCEFCNTNRSLVDGVLELVRSLGIRASMQGFKTQGNRLPAWRIHFTPPSGVVPFTLSRKIARCERLKEPSPTKKWHYVKEVRRVTNKDTKCISVSSESHLYLAGESLVPTHNSLYRHAYKHFYYKEKLEAIDAIGQERKAVGVPVVYPPEGASEHTKEEVEAVLANLHTNEAAFIIMPGPKRQGTDGPNIGWDIEIITFDSSSSSGIKESIDQQTTKIAGAFMTDFLELGHHQVGARATAEVQEDPFLTSVNAFGGISVVPPMQRLGARIASMNIDGLSGFPKLRMAMHDEASLSEISTFVQQLIVAEALTPDNDLEDWLREHGNLPPANPDFRAEREAQRKRMRESEESDPTKTIPNAGGGAPSKSDKEISTTDEGKQGTTEKESTPTPSKKSLQLDAAASEPSGVMIALYPSEEVAQQLAIDGDDALSSEDLHITLAYLGKKDQLGDEEALRNTVAKWAADTPPIDAKAGGIGVFSPSKTSDGKPVIYVPIDAPKLSTHREGLVRKLKQTDLPVAEDHGFAPHMTLAYADRRNINPSELPIQFDHVTLVIGGKQEHFPLAGKKPIMLDTPSPPPNLRDSTDIVKRCGTCHMFNAGCCWGYGNTNVEPGWVCDSWEQSNIPQTYRLEASTAPWHEQLLSQGMLSDALDNSRENMELAARPTALKLATMAALRARSGRKIRMTAPADFQKAIATEFERLYTLGYRTVAEELLKQHQATGTDAVLTLDAADGEATITEIEQPEEITITPGKRQRRVARRAAIAAEHITGEATREAERQALTKRDSLTQQRAVEAKVNSALHREALSNTSSIINEGRKDAALAAVAMFAAKSAVYGRGEGANSIGGPEIKLQGIYTAVLDGRVCDACALADDGEEREPDDPALEVPNPICAGIDYCRCTVVWVLNISK